MERNIWYLLVVSIQSINKISGDIPNRFIEDSKAKKGT